MLLSGRRASNEDNDREMRVEPSLFADSTKFASTAMRDSEDSSQRLQILGLCTAIRFRQAVIREEAKVQVSTQCGKSSRDKAMLLCSALLRFVVGSELGSAVGCIHATYSVKIHLLDVLLVAARPFACGAAPDSPLYRVQRWSKTLAAQDGEDQGAARLRQARPSNYRKAWRHIAVLNTTPFDAAVHLAAALPQSQLTEATDEFF
ncbi:hypothetical protein J1614_002778 [Plenodomus biglobosus]|nr:hypothetical protein J1614_002778 [Plenodomus biglobosus]